MKAWIAILSLSSLPAVAADVRVLEPSTRPYAGNLSFIESGTRPRSHCKKIGVIVLRGAAFSAPTIRKMQIRGSSMGADTLLIKDTTIGPVTTESVIRMDAYKCK